MIITHSGSFGNCPAGGRSLEQVAPILSTAAPWLLEWQPTCQKQCFNSAPEMAKSYHVLEIFALPSGCAKMKEDDRRKIVQLPSPESCPKSSTPTPNP